MTIIRLSVVCVWFLDKPANLKLCVYLSIDGMVKFMRQAGRVTKTFIRCGTSSGPDTVHISEVVR